MSGRMSGSSTGNMSKGKSTEGLASTSQNAPNSDDSNHEDSQVVEDGLIEELYKTDYRSLCQWHPVNLSKKKALARAAANRRICKQLESETSTIDQIGGLGEIMTVVWNMIRLPLDRPEEASRHVKPSRGLIVHGVKGVGKTMLIKALVEGCRRYHPKMTAFVLEMFHYFKDDIEDRLAEVFDMARRLRPSIIFLDTFDDLVPLNSPNVRTLGALMDALDDSGSVFVVAATNDLDEVDPEIRKLGRFDTEIPIDLPNLEARKDILIKMTKNWGLPPSVIDTVAEKTPDFTGADLSGVCRAAMNTALDRTYPNFKRFLARRDIDHEPIDNKKIHVNMEDFQKAVRTIQSTKQLQQNGKRKWYSSSDDSDDSDSD